MLSSSESFWAQKFCCTNLCSERGGCGWCREFFCFIMFLVIIVNSCEQTCPDGAGWFDEWFFSAGVCTQNFYCLCAIGDKPMAYLVLLNANCRYHGSADTAWAATSSLIIDMNATHPAMQVDLDQLYLSASKPR